MAKDIKNEKAYCEKELKLNLKLIIFTNLIFLFITSLIIAAMLLACYTNNVSAASAIILLNVIHYIAYEYAIEDLKRYRKQLQWTIKNNSENQ